MTTFPTVHSAALHFLAWSGEGVVMTTFPTLHSAALHFLAWSGEGVVMGAGVVATGPHTASFLKVQNFL